MPELQLLDLEPQTDDLLAEVLAGLNEEPKLLPCKLLYDKRGSLLFDEICELPEYYPTRTEMAIMAEHVDDMAAMIGPDALLIELGSGSSLKTHRLLEALDRPAGYVPIDISRDHLLASAHRINAAYPGLEVLPVCADYLQNFEVPEPTRPARRRVVYFPGSTIGNFHRPEARQFLGRIADLAGGSGPGGLGSGGSGSGGGGMLLIGVDLRKSPAVLIPAYDDAQGVTAAFNLNLLERVNRETGADFDPAAYDHCAVWNDDQSRIEMHLVARSNQTIRIAGRMFTLGAGESIRTECSYKHTLEGFADLAPDFNVERVWTDADRLFSVQLLTVRD